MSNHSQGIEPRHLSANCILCICMLWDACHRGSSFLEEQAIKSKGRNLSTGRIYCPHRSIIKNCISCSSDGGNKRYTTRLCLVNYPFMFLGEDKHREHVESATTQHAQGDVSLWSHFTIDARRVSRSLSVTQMIGNFIFSQPGGGQASLHLTPSIKSWLVSSVGHPSVPCQAKGCVKNKYMQYITQLSRVLNVGPIKKLAFDSAICDRTAQPCNEMGLSFSRSYVNPFLFSCQAHHLSCCVLRGPIIYLY